MSQMKEDNTSNRENDSPSQNTGYSKRKKKYKMYRRKEEENKKKKKKKKKNKKKRLPKKCPKSI